MIRWIFLGAFLVAASCASAQLIGIFPDAGSGSGLPPVATGYLTQLSGSKILLLQGGALQKV
jgi:hypothetical protein